MWIYLARNLKADPNILVLLTYVSTEIGTVTQRSLYRDLFDQNGMEYLYVKPRLLMKKCWFYNSRFALSRNQK